jgi:hypothetical protein
MLTMMSMMNATDTHADTPFWVPHGRFHAQGATALRAIGADSLIIRSFAGFSDVPADCADATTLIKTANGLGRTIGLVSSVERRRPCSADRDDADQIRLEMG